jgi:hypothetical protein
MVLVVVGSGGSSGDTGLKRKLRYDNYRQRLFIEGLDWMAVCFTRVV